MRATLRELVNNQYSRNDIDIGRGKFWVRGDVIEIGPAYDDRLVRIELFGDEIESIKYIDPITGEIIDILDSINVYPAKHFVTPKDRLDEEHKRIDRLIQKNYFFISFDSPVTLKKIDELALIYPKEDLKSIFLEIMKTSLKQQKSND